MNFEMNFGLDHKDIYSCAQVCVHLGHKWIKFYLLYFENTHIKTSVPFLMLNIVIFLQLWRLRKTIKSFPPFPPRPVLFALCPPTALNNAWLNFLIWFYGEICTRMDLEFLTIYEKTPDITVLFICMLDANMFVNLCLVVC